MKDSRRGLGDRMVVNRSAAHVSRSSPPRPDRASLTLRRQRRLALFLAAASLACAPAPRSGDTVEVSEESAIIIWDEGAKTQHFIRRASFRTDAKDFGFLVPTPTVPELKEASDVAFTFLGKLTRTRSVRPAPASAGLMGRAAAGAPVTVAAQAKVSGYDASVLEARDAKALGAWLQRHGYASSPELVEWVKPYLERRWKITAFKIDHDAQNQGRAETTAVRMSFKTDEPFFPYREPVIAQRSASGVQQRLLRVYMLATARMEGVLGASAVWPGRVVWADRISDPDRTALLEYVQLAGTVAPDALWLTKFEDESSPRPGVNDLAFRAAADQSAWPGRVEVPPLHEPPTRLPSIDRLELGAAILLLVGLPYVAWRLVSVLLRKPRS